MSMQKGLKKVVILCYKTLFHTAYLLFSFLKKTDKDKAVFALSRSKELDGNLKYVYDELIKQEPHVKIHFVYTENKMNLKLFKEIWMISNASYVIIDDYFLPIYLIHPKKDLKVIQLWHAAGAFKKFGHSTVNTKFGPSSSYLKMVPVHSNYTHVYVSSARLIPYYAEAFNMSPDRIFPFGPPRIDLFNNGNKIEEIKQNLARDYSFIENQKKVIILVAPTYRARGDYRESDVNFIDILMYISKYIDNHVQIIFKGHPYFKKKEKLRLQECPNITVISTYSINELMLVADALVTDYSSCIFDFSLLQKPFAHFIPDMEEYFNSRGVYERIEHISDGDILIDENRLINWMNIREKNEHYDTTRMVTYNFDYTQDVTKKIVSHFREN